MYFVDRAAVVIKPTESFLIWLKSVDKEGVDLTLAQLRSDCTVLMVPEFDEPEDVIAYVDEHYEAIFKAELAAWYESPKDWPSDMSLKAFWTFFDVQVNSTVLDLVDEPMHNMPVVDNMM
ncbi:MAG: hypothetical protein KA214_09620 [Neisseriaceae bacterium]|nr:hypothetical protein [Neisseriaceae bacterium]